MIYFDSSLLLELYLEGPRWRDARGILDAPEPKASSYLLVAEVAVSLRRALPQVTHGEVLGAALRRFEADLIDITLVDTFVDTVTRIRSDPRFARCRTLDAIHACTALLLREWTGQSVRVATFDRRLSDLAAELGLN